MYAFLTSSLFLCVVVSLAAYAIGVYLHNKLENDLVNPLLIAIALVLVFLLVTGLPYKDYMKGSSYISFLLTPATICLAVPLYEQMKLLTRNFTAIIGGITTGMVAGLITVFLFAKLFHFDHASYVTLLPKSITTAIGMGVSEELGGYVSITVVAIIATGVVGNIFAEQICRLFHITDPVAKGIACGSAAHAMGTSKAMEMGAVEGAMSSLAMVAAGIMTVAGASLFAVLI